MQHDNFRPIVELQHTLASAGTVLLDDQIQPNAPALVYSQPEKILTCCRPREVPDLLQELDDLVGSGYHAAGYLAYEAGYAFELEVFQYVQHRDYAQRLGYPLIWMGIYRDRQTVSHELMQAALPQPASTLTLTPEFTPQDYRAKIRHIQKLIAAGDIYQMNFTQRLHDDSDSSFEALYALLRAEQPVAYSAFIQLGGVQILSASPELFFSRDQRKIICKPMKGTIRRGSTKSEDALLQQHLALDAKNRAENLMIVDLIRNDLSRVCRVVETPRLFQIETYKTLLQMTSQVEGELAKTQDTLQTDSIGYHRIFAALFPCGSITGAPKVATMKRIQLLENSPRGIYCGAIGHITPHRQATFSVAIRTLSRVRGRLKTGSGGGIVWDSAADAEHDECLLKTRFLTHPESALQKETQIIETMRWQSGIELLEYHIKRLINTASLLSFSFSEEAVRNEINQATDRCVGSKCYRVRILLAVDGALHSSCLEIDRAQLQPPMRFILASNRTHSQDPFLKIKTTLRPVYDRARCEQLSDSIEEVVFQNERGELTEGTITNLFLRFGQQWYTPPLHAGLLPGIMRAQIMKSDRKPRQKSLYPNDLLHADEILLTNAVRGAREGIFISPQQGLRSVFER